jgi:hypothetical protein
MRVEEVAAHLMADRKQREKKGMETRYNLQRNTPRYLFPPARKEVKFQNLPN